VRLSKSVFLLFRYLRAATRVINLEDWKFFTLGQIGLILIKLGVPNTYAAKFCVFINPMQSDASANNYTRSIPK